MTDVAETLKARGATHGDFTDHARIAQELKAIVRGGPRWGAMAPFQHEAIEMILHKIARACAGNPDHADHFHDIAGYARLVEERLP